MSIWSNRVDNDVIFGEMSERLFKLFKIADNNDNIPEGKSGVEVREEIESAADAFENDSELEAKLQELVKKYKLDIDDDESFFES